MLYNNYVAWANFIREICSKISAGEVLKMSEEKNLRETTKKKVKKTGLALKLVLMSLLPVIILGVFLAVYTINVLKSSMQSEIQAGLESTATALAGAYTAIPGDFATDKDGNVVKGETVITGDYTIVDYIKEQSDVEATFFYQDTRTVTSLKNGSERNVGTKAADIVVEEVIKNGNDFFDTDLEIGGEKYYAYYVPVKNSEGSVVGMAFTGKSQADVSRLIQKARSKIMSVTVVIDLITSAVVLVIAYLLIKALQHAMEDLKTVSTGDLTGVTNMKMKARKDEIGEIIAHIDELKESLKSIISNIQNSSNVLTESANSLEMVATKASNVTEGIGEAINEIASGACTQASETDAAAKNVENMGEMIQHMVESANQLNKNADNMGRAGEEAAKIIGELNESNNKTIHAVEKIGKQTKTTNDSAQQIKQAVSLISSIAEETNLLSLNASIEAARAGEQGRGFAVVASQIQKLAEQSNSSAQQIEQIITELLSDSEKTVEIMSDVTGIVAEQQEKLDATKSKFEEVSSEICVSLEGIKEIQNKTELLDEARAKIVDVITNLSAISEENAASAEETTASTEELNASVSELASSAEQLKEMAASLENEIKIFKI